MRGWFGALLVAALTVALLFLILPIVAIFVDTRPQDLVASLGEEGALEALRLSLLCSAVAVVEGAQQPEQAKAFIAGLLDGAGSDGLRAAGFEPPPTQ